MDVNEAEMREIQHLIEEYLKTRKMENIEVDVYIMGGDGVNYVSTILKASSKSDKNGQAFEEKYVIKFLKRDERLIQGDAPVEDNHTFEWSKCEVYAYEEVFPAMFELQSKYNVKTDFSPAELVSALIRNDKQFIIFKDLTSMGFTLRDRNLMLDAPHVAVVMRRLAQFHAFSMALRHLDAEKYREVTAVNMEEKLFANNPVFGELLDKVAHLQLAALIERTENEEIRGKLIKIKGRFTEICYKLATGNHAAPYSVISHGDLWNNNVMFKYKDNKPVDAVILDWQVMRHNSPVLDLFHVITTSIDESLQNSEGFDFVIDTYYKNLSDELAKYSLDSNTVFPKDVLWAHLRTYAPLGLRLCTTMWIFHCRLYDDTLAPHKLVKDINTIFDMSAASKNRYERMWDFLLEVFNKNGMLDVECLS